MDNFNVVSSTGQAEIWGKSIVFLQLIKNKGLSNKNCPKGKTKKK